MLSAVQYPLYSPGTLRVKNVADLWREMVINDVIVVM